MKERPHVNSAMLYLGIALFILYIVVAFTTWVALIRYEKTSEQVAIIELCLFIGGFKCEVQHPSVIEQEAGPWDWPEPERGLVAGSASSGFCAGGR